MNDAIEMWAQTNCMSGEPYEPVCVAQGCDHRSGHRSALYTSGSHGTQAIITEIWSNRAVSRDSRVGSEFWVETFIWSIGQTLRASVSQRSESQCRTALARAHTCATTEVFESIQLCLFITDNQISSVRWKAVSNLWSVVVFAIANRITNLYSIIQMTRPNNTFNSADWPQVTLHRKCLPPLWRTVSRLSTAELSANVIGGKPCHLA